jgi:hypothetical protein
MQEALERRQIATKVMRAATEEIYRTTKGIEGATYGM